MAHADTRPPPKARPDKPAFKARPATPPVKKPPVSLQPSSKAKASAASSSSTRPVADRPTMPKARENPRPISTEGQSQFTQWSKGAWIALLKCAHGSIGINRAKREQIFEWDLVERLMKSLSYVCRHHESRPSDNAWSIRELMELPEIPKKLKNIARERNNEIMPRFQLAQLDIEHKPLLDPLNFMLPLILGVFYNPKNRFEVAIATTEDLERNPEHRPLSDEFVHVGIIMISEQKAAFATAISDISDGLVFIRAVGGHSKSETIKNTPNAEILNPYNVKFLPDILVHVTPFRNAFSIARQGLIPGGPDGRREHIHFLPLHALVHSPEHCRPNGDVVLFYSAVDLDSNNIPLFMTKNYYIVTDTPIPHHCCIFAYDVRNKTEVKHKVFPLVTPETIEQHEDYQTIMNVLSFYEEYFNNRLTLVDLWNNMDCPISCSFDNSRSTPDDRALDGPRRL